MTIVAIKDMSAGNDSVGETWQETKIFDSQEPIENIIKWVQTKYEFDYNFPVRKRITITVPHTEIKE